MKESFKRPAKGFGSGAGQTDVGWLNNGAAQKIINS